MPLRVCGSSPSRSRAGRPSRRARQFLSCLSLPTTESQPVFSHMSNSESALAEATTDSLTVPATAVRVVHVVLSLDIGGLERIVADLVRVGRALGQIPSVICLERPGTLAAQVESLGVPVLCADKPPGLRLETIGRVRELLRQLRPDVLHTHQIGALVYAGPAARRERIPVVVHTEHTNTIARHRSLSRQFRTRLLWG